LKTRGKQRARKRSLSGVIAVVASLTLLGAGITYFSNRHAVALERVAVDHVCMVNDTYFPKPQIPVDVGSKTYFGCCEMCEGRLASDAAVRVATDPVSGRPVDKADAVIGALASGKVFYFESERTLAEYQRTTSR
jgi:YHS domain-containing protein